MKKLSALLTVFAIQIFSIPAFSQAQATESGKISGNVLEMKYYSPDPEAEAVVIYSIGDTRFFLNALGEFEIHFIKRIMLKIFNKKGYTYAEVDIPSYKNSTVKINKATTFNLENGIVTTTNLDPKAVFEEKINEYWYRNKFAMPNIKDGSVIEYEYEYVTTDKFNIPGWDFQLTIPVIKSEYYLHVIPYYQYQYILQGTNKFSSMNQSEDKVNIKYFGTQPYYEMVYQFIMTDLPAFRDEAYITNISDYQIKMDFQLSRINRPDGTTSNLVSTWPSLNDELLNTPEFGKYINSSENEAAKYLKNFDMSGLNNLEKIEKISEMIKMDFKWNGMERLFTTKSPKEFIKQKTGNSTEINLFLQACLKTQEIEAYPVILSTRDHGKINADYPFLHFFNYTLVLAKTNDKQLLLDATDLFLPWDRIPINCINESGLIVQKKTANWVNLASADQGSSISEKIAITINPDRDSLDCSIRISSNGYYASDLKHKTGIKYENIKEELASRGLNPDDSVVIKNFVERKKDYILEFTGHPKFDRLENRILITPFFKEAMQENILKSPTRVYPIDFIYKKSREFVTSIAIPEGYKIYYLPEDYSVNHNLVSINYSTKNVNNNLIIVGRYEFKKYVYNPGDYLNLKYFISEIVKKFNDKIIIEKVL